MKKLKVIGVLGASAIILAGAVVMTQKKTTEVPPQTEETTTQIEEVKVEADEIVKVVEEESKKKNTTSEPSVSEDVTQQVTAPSVATERIASVEIAPPQELRGAADSPNAREIAAVEIVYPRTLNPQNDPCEDTRENIIIELQEGITLCDMSDKQLSSLVGKFEGGAFCECREEFCDDTVNFIECVESARISTTNKAS